MTLMNVTDYCFVFARNVTMTWGDASHYCMANGGHLLTRGDDELMNERVEEVLNQYGVGYKLWAGMRKHYVDHWIWNENKTLGKWLSFTNVTY